MLKDFFCFHANSFNLNWLFITSDWHYKMWVSDEIRRQIVVVARSNKNICITWNSTSFSPMYYSKIIILNIKITTNKSTNEQTKQIPRRRQLYQNHKKTHKKPQSIVYYGSTSFERYSWRNKVYNSKQHINRSEIKWWYIAMDDPGCLDCHS